MSFLSRLWDTIFHLSPEKLGLLADETGVWMYVVLFAIIFCETGLVATPFLPGDSLLFAVGAVAASSTTISLPWLLILLIVAAVLGDAVNYAIGYYLGPKVFSREDSRLLNKKHLLEAQRFYEKYGSKTIILARFVPIVRTFAPFVAGIGKMNYSKFGLFNVTGAIVWVSLFLLAGYQFGEKFKKDFKLIIMGILVLSVLPMVYEIWKARRLAANASISTRLPSTDAE